MKIVVSTVSPWKVRCIETVEGSASVSGSIVAEFYCGPVRYDDDKDRWSGRYCNKYMLTGWYSPRPHQMVVPSYRSATQYQKGRHHLMHPPPPFRGPPILAPTQGPIQSPILRTLQPRHRSSHHHQSYERSQYGFNGCFDSGKVRLVGLE
jgi:hypothetical protein